MSESINYVVYNDIGEIDGIVGAVRREHVGVGHERFISVGRREDVTCDLHYIDLSGNYPVVRDRIPLPVSHQSSGLLVVLSGLPEGTEVEVMGKFVMADSGPTEIEFEIPGHYILKLTPPPPYLRETLEVALG